MAEVLALVLSFDGAPAVPLAMTDNNPVIIKLHPHPEEYVEAETAFLRAVGLCVTRWAFVDRQLFRLFRYGIGTSTDRAAIVYYKQNSIGPRLTHVVNLMKSRLELDLPPREGQNMSTAFTSARRAV
jgi:hypothetical protein